MSWNLAVLFFDRKNKTFIVVVRISFHFLEFSSLENKLKSLTLYEKKVKIHCKM